MFIKYIGRIELFFYKISITEQIFDNVQILWGGFNLEYGNLENGKLENVFVSKIGKTGISKTFNGFLENFQWLSRN